MEPRRQNPGEPAPVYGDFDGLFTVEIHHKGFFSGTDNSNDSYIDYEVDWFDHCECDTWSILWIEDFVKQLGYDRETGQHVVYWCQPGRTINFKAFNPETDLNAPVFRLGMVFGCYIMGRRE